jgi:hypothetical protein
MNQKHLLLSLFAVLLLVFGDCARQSVLAQTPDTQSGPASQNTKVLQPLPDRTGTGWNSAHNRWQLTAVDPKSRIDTVSPLIRAQRNAYWQGPQQHSHRILSGEGNIGGPLVLRSAPELPYLKGATWVIATFESFQVFAADPDYDVIYSEMNFRVEHVVRTPNSIRLSTGDLIALDFRGGRIKTAQGNTVSSLLSPSQYFYQPGHTYLLQLLHVDQGDFFFSHKRWDVTSGTVQPDDVGEIDRAGRGASMLNGMPVNALINFLPSALPDEPKE